MSEKNLLKVTALILVITWIYNPNPTSTNMLIVSTTLISLMIIWVLRPNHQDALLPKESDREDGDHCKESSIEDLSDEEPTMNHVIEGNDDNATSPPPPILTPEQIKEIHNRALPLTTRLMTWKRIYSLAQDGDSFIHMMNRCKPYQHVLIVFRTSNNGHILGGYTATSWNTARDTRAMFFGGTGGGGKAFVFATHPDMSREEQIKYQDQFWRTNRKDSLYIFKCSGRNDYVQICDWKKGALGMGGGGASNSTFGWYVQDNFTVGSTGYCETFCNPPLHNVGQKDGRFEIVDMDIYGFESMSMSFQNSGS